MIFCHLFLRSKEGVRHDEKARQHRGRPGEFGQEKVPRARGLALRGGEEILPGAGSGVRGGCDVQVGPAG